ncbi:hypothetical protein [Photorhabdus caribbeanensis]|uniref:hypothetical protein n=1 Tax=Photorhabdus caribbeanensis TaxID=1004165 RepID=UPI001BD25D89|nr:hypothetical protein [Photorhabdus caribbeanensis]MBS9422251.1 hypothetical protein [Photorhabdus caribbeanensis]
MTAHIHAKNMALYAQDALKTNEPWLLWEFKGEGCKKFSTLASHPSWYEDVIYRRKPEMIKIGKVSFPKPVDYELKHNDEYFIFDLSAVRKYRWNNDSVDEYYLKIGVLHLTKEAAHQHFDALVKINKGEF